MSDERIYTTDEKISAIERELRFRHRVYATKVAEGRMKPSAMGFQIGVFEAMLEDYRKIQGTERLL